MVEDMKITAGNTAVRRMIIEIRRECIENSLDRWVSDIPSDYRFRDIDDKFYYTDLMYINKALSIYDEYIAG